MCLSCFLVLVYVDSLLCCSDRCTAVTAVLTTSDRSSQRGDTVCSLRAHNSVPQAVQESAAVDSPCRAGAEIQAQKSEIPDQSGLSCLPALSLQGYLSLVDSLWWHSGWTPAIVLQQARIPVHCVKCSRVAVFSVGSVLGAGTVSSPCCRRIAVAASLCFR